VQGVTPETQMTRTAKMLLATCTALAVLLFTGGNAGAATATGTITVTASVGKQCSLGSPTLAFGAYDPTAAVLDVSTVLNVNCTKTTPFTIGLGNGSNFSGGNRFMKDSVSSDTLHYELYSDSAHTTVWNAANTVAGTGGTNTTETVYGRLFTGQFVTPGSYSDTVVATVTF
jgi:spore coat protein U domain-containing protein, fimbrial subunit CupE1/2/3/6